MPKFPPEKVPDGLTSEEYHRLSLLYAVVGRMDEAEQAIRRSSSPPSEAQLQETPLSQMTPDEQMAYGESLGKQFGSDLLKLTEDGSKNLTLLEERLRKAFEPMRGSFAKMP